MSDVHDQKNNAKRGNGKDEQALHDSALNAVFETAEPDSTVSDQEATTPGDEASLNDGQVEVLSMEEEFHRLLKEKDDLLVQKHDQFLRSQADHENYKKRMAREKEELVKFGNERLMRELLPILDNFERSLTHAKNAKSLEGVLGGIDLIQKEMLTTLTKYGLREVSAKGEKFDPSMHEATAQVPTADHPEGTVIDEFQKGYFVHDRLLRPAMVIVAGPPVEPEAEDKEE